MIMVLITQMTSEDPGKTHIVHHANMSMYYRPPYAPLLYREFLIYNDGGLQGYTLFALKHRLWVLVYPQSMF